MAAIFCSSLAFVEAMSRKTLGAASRCTKNGISRFASAISRRLAMARPMGHCVAALSMAVIYLAVAPRAEAGFFEDLFGALGATQAPAPAPGGASQRGAHFRSSWGGHDVHKKTRAFARGGRSLHAQPRFGSSIPTGIEGGRSLHAQARRDGDALLAKSEDGPRSQPQFCSLGNYGAKVSDPTEALLHDSTLRRGDVVIIDKGLRIFEGHEGCPHRADDFRSLAEVHGVPAEKRIALAAIERAMKRNYFSRAEGRTIATRTTVAGQ